MCLFCLERYYERTVEKRQRKTDRQKHKEGEGYNKKCNESKQKNV